MIVALFLTTVNEVNDDRTKIPDKFVFRCVLLACLADELDSISKLIHNRCTCKFITKITAAFMYAHEQLRLCVYVLVISVNIHQCL